MCVCHIYCKCDDMLEILQHNIGMFVYNEVHLLSRIVFPIKELNDQCVRY